MKKIFFILIITILSINLSGQTRKGYLDIEIGDTATPIAGCYESSSDSDNLESSINAEDSEIPIYDPFYIGYFQYPLFHGAYVEEFYVWLSNRLSDVLPGNMRYSCDVTIYFTIKDDCSVVDVSSSINNVYKDGPLVASLVSGLILTSKCWSAPLMIKNQKYEVPIFIHIKMNKYAPNRRKRVIVRPCKFEYTDSLRKNSMTTDNTIK